MVSPGSRFGVLAVENEANITSAKESVELDVNARHASIGADGKNMVDGAIKKIIRTESLRQKVTHMLHKRYGRTNSYSYLAVIFYKHPLNRTSRMARELERATLWLLVDMNNLQILAIFKHRESRRTNRAFGWILNYWITLKMLPLYLRHRF